MLLLTIHSLGICCQIIPNVSNYFHCKPQAEKSRKNGVNSFFNFLFVWGDFCIRKLGIGPRRNPNFKHEYNSRIEKP